jgi:hypothetical protein
VIGAFIVGMFSEKIFYSQIIHDVYQTKPSKKQIEEMNSKRLQKMRRATTMVSKENKVTD